MEPTKEALTAKITELKQQLPIYARNAQSEVNAIQQALQNKIRDAQKTIDNLEGRLASYEELLKEMEGTSAPASEDTPPTPPANDGSQQEGPTTPTNKNEAILLEPPVA